MPPAEKQLILTTEDVSLTSASVCLKTIQVNRKQMTQAVFRQLEECKLVDEDKILLNGTVWGYVRYYWGQQRAHQTHFFVQQGEYLRRALFWVRDLPRNGEGMPSGWMELWLALDVLSKAHLYRDLLDGWKPANYQDRIYTNDELKWQFEQRLPVDIRYVLGEGSYQSIPRAELTRKYELDALDSENKAGETARKKMQEFLATNIPAPSDMATINREIKSLKSEALLYCKRWNELMASLRRAEQLFIAV